MMRKGLARKLKKLLGNESGQAVLEFALILPLLLILLMGVLDFGWIFMNQYRVEKAASTAARYGAIHESQYASTSTRSGFLDALSNEVADNLPDGAEDSILCVDVSRGARPASRPESSTLVCVDVRSAAKNVSVTVTYPVRTLTFVSNTLYGKYYLASSTSVSSF